MSGLVRKSFDSPEETRPFEDAKGKLDLVNVEGGPVGRATFGPGWRWSKQVKPIAGIDSCQAAHMGYFISGHMKDHGRRRGDGVRESGAIAARSNGAPKSCSQPVSCDDGSERRTGRDGTTPSSGSPRKQH